jgi:hypothetical protein
MVSHIWARNHREKPATTCRELVGGYYVCTPLTSTDILPLSTAFFAAQQFVIYGGFVGFFPHLLTRFREMSGQNSGRHRHYDGTGHIFNNLFRYF